MKKLVMMLLLGVTMNLNPQNNKPTVAVMYFSNGAIGAAHNDLEPLSKGIADMLITDLSNNPTIRVVERDQLQKLLEEQKLSASGSVSKETAVKVGKLLGAHHMIFGGFVTDPMGRMRLDARAVNVETSEIEHVESVTDKTDNLMTMIANLAGKLNTGMKLPAIPTSMRAEAAVKTQQQKAVPFQAVMLYSRALSEQDKGNKQEAVKLYKASLDKFPNYAAAKAALAKLDS